MPSRAEARRAIESAWRALALALLAWAIVAAFTPRAREVVRLGDASLAAALPEMTHAGEPVALDVTLGAAPVAESRAWLAALRHAGSEVRWRAEGTIPPLAVEVVARADPAGGVRAMLAATPGERVILTDAGGPLDTTSMSAPATARRLPAFVPPLTARAGAQPANAVPPDSLAPRRVLVLGGAAWEGKFVLAALEERGWLARARFAIAPGLAVEQGSAFSLDTATFSTVIVLDSAAADGAAAAAAFARQGGGLVLAGDAARNPRLAPFAPGRIGTRVRPLSIAFSDSAPRRALGFDAITALARDAISLESREGRVAVAARRVGAARVVQVGYDETWRWRFAGGPHAVEAHRRWWSDLVSSAAHRSPMPLDPTTASPYDAAPLARLTMSLGAPVVEVPVPRSPFPVPSSLPWWLFGAMLAALLAEWASRRLRGAP